MSLSSVQARRERASSTTGRGTPAPAVVAAACLGFFLITLDVSIVNVALPTIGERLGADVTGLQWIVDGYALPFAGLLLSAGAVTDRIGANRAFVAGLAGFTLASAACGLAPSAGALIAARVVQGCAAALMLPASLSLVRRSSDSAVGRARAVAVWTAAGGAAAAAGPVVGGVLTDTLGWRAVFAVNVPLGILALAVLRGGPRSPRRPSPLDLAGQATSVLAVGAVVLAVIEAGAHGVATPAVGVAGAVAVGAGAAFVVAERRSAHPAVPLGMFRAPTVAITTAVGFALNLGFYGMVFVLTLFVQTQRGASPLATGLMFLPMTGLVAGVNLLAGHLTTRFGPRPPLVAGQIVMAGGFVALLGVGPATPTALLLLAMVPLGIGGGLAAPPLTAALLEAVPADRSGLASGVLNAARQLGGALGVALFGALTVGAAGFVDGMHLSVTIGALVLAATSIAATALPRHLGRSGPRTEVRHVSATRPVVGAGNQPEERR